MVDPRKVLCSALFAVFGRRVAIDFPLCPVRIRRVPTNLRGLRMDGGPGTRDPGRMSYHNLTIPDFIVVAYKLEQYQVLRPHWMDTGRRDVVQHLGLKSVVVTDPHRP